jgi:hypothetical protein
MADGKSVNEMLSDAKNVLKGADALSKSASSGGPSSFAPKHEYSDAPYSMVKAKPAGPGLDKELQVKKEMVDTAKKAL